MTRKFIFFQILYSRGHHGEIVNQRKIIILTFCDSVILKIEVWISEMSNYDHIRSSPIIELNNGFDKFLAKKTETLFKNICIT